MMARSCAMLRVLDGEHVEAEVRYSVAGSEPGDGGMKVHLELCKTASGAIATARRFRADGSLKVQITDMRTNKPCDEADLERAAAAKDG